VSRDRFQLKHVNRILVELIVEGGVCGEGEMLGDVAAVLAIALGATVAERAVDKVVVDLATPQLLKIEGDKLSQVKLFF
jgi:hypothetical protein